MKKLIHWLLLGMFLWLATGCGQRAIAVCDEFDKSYKGYNRMLRWQEVENAGMLYLEQEKRDEFMKLAEELRKRKVTITDYRVLTTECVADKFKGDVITEFDYYILPSNRIKTLTYRQEWLYKDLLKHWKLKSMLPTFE